MEQELYNLLAEVNERIDKIDNRYERINNNVKLAKETSSVFMAEEMRYINMIREVNGIEEQRRFYILKTLFLCIFASAFVSNVSMWLIIPAIGLSAFFNWIDKRTTDAELDKYLSVKEMSDRIDKIRKEREEENKNLMVLIQEVKEERMELVSQKITLKGLRDAVLNVLELLKHEKPLSRMLFPDSYVDPQKEATKVLELAKKM